MVKLRMQMKVLMVQSANVFRKILLLFFPVLYILKGFKKHNLKRVNLVNQRASRKNKLKRQILRSKKCPKMTNYLKKKIIYMSQKKCKYILVYLDVCYVVLVTGCFNYV